MPQACFARVPAGLASALSRPGAALDAFLLKIVVEERLGYPVQLLSDGQIYGTLGNGSIYSALARGEVDMYPEVTPVNAMPYAHGNLQHKQKSALDPMHRCGRP